jgi:hypothetical protein
MQNHTCTARRTKRYSIAHTRYSLIIQQHEHMQQHDNRESVHRDIILKATNKMQLYKLIYYS